MRRFTTSVATDRPARPVLGLLLAVELVIAVVLLVRTPDAPGSPPAAVPAASDPPAAASTALVLRDGRSADLLALGGEPSAALAERISAELDPAEAAVTAFWGEAWPRHVDLVLTGTDEEFRIVGGGTSDIAATAMDTRIVFAPGAAAMSADSLRIVLRHELFHFAARAETAADAPRWLTEGVADFVGRPPAPVPGAARAAELAQLPTDADLDTPGRTRSLAYDRAWWFSRFVADRYGTETLRRLYLTACGPGHADVATAIRTVLGVDTGQVLAAWRAWLAG